MRRLHLAAWLSFPESGQIAPGIWQLWIQFLRALISLLSLLMAIQMVMQEHSEAVPRVRRLRIQLNRMPICLLGLLVALLVSKDIAKTVSRGKAILDPAQSRADTLARPLHNASDYQRQSQAVPGVTYFGIQLNRVAIRLLGLLVTLLIAKGIAQSVPRVRAISDPGQSRGDTLARPLGNASDLVRKLPSAIPSQRFPTRFV